MKNTYLCADPHGSVKPFRDFYKLAGGGHDIIVLGDFGANFFFNHRDEQYKKDLGKFDFTYFVIRGNHEERPEICDQKFPMAWNLRRMRWSGVEW